MIKASLAKGNLTHQIMQPIFVLFSAPANLSASSR